MSDELRAIAERIRQRRAAVTATTTAGGPASDRGFRLGDAVFDSVSGFDGTVTGAGLAARLRVNDVRVHLDDGRDVIRTAGELIARPAAGQRWTAS